MKYMMKEDLERRYLELLEEKKINEREIEEMKFVLNNKNLLIKDLEKKLDYGKQQQTALEEQFQIVKRDIEKIN